MTSASLDPYRQVQRLTWFGSAALALGLLVVVHLVLRANVARALRPVHEMSGQASRWSVEDGDHRFGSPPSRRARRSRGTLDELLDRLAAVLRRERQLSDELSHELRTPLARIQAEVDLLGSRPRTGGARPGAGHHRRGGRIDERHHRDADDDGPPRGWRRPAAATSARCCSRWRRGSRNAVRTSPSIWSSRSG